MATRYRYRARLFVYLLTTVLFLGGAAVALLIARGYTIDIASGEINETGLLVLNSTPNDAFITVDNELRDSRTSTRVKLPGGEYQVKIDRPEVVPWEKRLRVEPGQAVLEENILLFLKEPVRKQLTPVTLAHATSANSRFIAYLEPGAPTPTAVIRETLTETEPVRLGALPAGFVPVGMAVSADGLRVAVSSAAQTMVFNRSGQPTSTIPAGGRVSFVPNDNDRLIAERAGQPGVFRVPTGTQEAEEAQVVSWTVVGSEMYVVSVNGGFSRRDLRSGNREVVSAPRPLAEVTSTTGAVFVRDAQLALYVLEGATLRKIAEPVQRFASNANGSAVTYLSGGELQLWNPRDGQSRLVTRFGDAPDGLAIVTDGHYLLYTLRGELHSIEDDGSNDHSFGLAGTTPPVLVDAFTTLHVSAERGLSTVTLLKR